MASNEVDLGPVGHITAGAVGPPGKRVFYLQARKDNRVVTLIVEKAQLESLAIGVEHFLEGLQERFPDLEAAQEDYLEEEMALASPIDPIFRVGQIGLGYDEQTDQMLLVARQIQLEDTDPEEAQVARFWCTRSQLLNLCHWSLELASRGRKICANCGLPIDPEGHFCPKSNGHKH